MILNTPYPPDLNDLYRLYKFIIDNNRTTILEFGSGWSSIIFLIALSELKEKKSKMIKKLRRKHPFELFIVENEKKYLDISRKRIERFIKKLKIKKPPKIHYNLTDVYMTTFQDRICTKYKKIPLCNPDFIYVDGPDQFKVIGDVSGISTRHQDFMPMQCDLLTIEYYLIPGTIIVFDGRSANAKFVKDHFKRSWKYKNDRVNDQHIFHLKDPILGKINKNLLNFYKK